MLGLKCKATNTDVVAAGYDAHILTVPAGDNVVRVLPALTISEEEIAEGRRPSRRRRDGAQPKDRRRLILFPSSFSKYGRGVWGAGGPPPAPRQPKAQTDDPFPRHQQDRPHSPQVNDRPGRRDESRPRRPPQGHPR